MRIVIGLFFGLILTYTLVGVSSNVEEIKHRAPDAIKERNWEIVRYEGYQLGSWGQHGGKVWYHVKDLGHKNTYYRVSISIWNDELHFYYSQPERLHRLNFDED